MPDTKDFIQGTEIGKWSNTPGSHDVVPCPLLICSAFASSYTLFQFSNKHFGYIATLSSGETLSIAELPAFVSDNVDDAAWQI